MYSDAAFLTAPLEGCAMEHCCSDSRKFFLCGMRVFFGSWLLYVGLVKWIVFTPAGFVGNITTMFDPTWSPHTLNVALAWLILVAEPLLGLFILSGICPRTAWILTSLLMFLLTIGQTILMKPDVIANWQYTVLALVCASLSEFRKSACCATKTPPEVV